MAFNASGEGHSEIEASDYSIHRTEPLFSTPEPSNREIDREKQKGFTLSESLGLNEFLQQDVWRASVAELLGSAVFVFMFDAIVISTYETDIKDPNLNMSILIAMTLVILRVTILPISGGHVSPVISFSAGLIGLISLSRALIYIFAQCIGAVLGALALKAVISNRIAENFSLGGCTVTVVSPDENGHPVTIGIGTAQAFFLEVICTFVMLFSSVWSAFDLRQAKKLGSVLVLTFIGTVVGLLTFISTTLTTKRGYAGVGMNPARCLGPAVVRGGQLWDGHWIFWAGPAIACFAFYFYSKIIPKEHFSIDGYKHDFFNVVMALIK